jgi:hypothetical protein
MLQGGTRSFAVTYGVKNMDLSFLYVTAGQVTGIPREITLKIRKSLHDRLLYARHTSRRKRASGTSS